MKSPKFTSPSMRRAMPIAAVTPMMPAGVPGSLTSTPIPTPLVATAAPSAAPGNAPAESIRLSTRSGGWNADGRPGDDGFTIVVEAFDAEGRPTSAGGNLTIAAIDPAIEDVGGRYARWDFTADDAAASYRGPTPGETGGFFFELPWPDAPPAHARMQLFVRYERPDGRRLEADREVRVDVPGAAPETGEPALMPALTADPISGLSQPDLSPLSEPVPGSSATGSLGLPMLNGPSLLPAAALETGDAANRSGGAMR